MELTANNLDLCFNVKKKHATELYEDTQETYEYNTGAVNMHEANPNPQTTASSTQ